MVAQQQGQALSWAVRGLRSSGTQTQYCRLWEANLCGAVGPARGGSGSNGGHECAASASGEGSVLCAAPSSASCGGSEDGAAPDKPAARSEAARVLPLAALQQQVRDIYRAKALHDIAVARGQRPFLPLADFVARHLELQSGADGAATRQRALQLQASVEAHAGACREVALFGLAAGMLEEAPPGPGGEAAGAVPVLVLQPSSAAGRCASEAPTAAAAAVPLVLYHARRRAGTAAQQAAQDALPPLRRFSAGAWHAAYLRSAARPPLPQPFDPAGGAGGPGLHPMAAEVHNLALGTPGLEQLMGWVLEGGLGACLPRLDLGLRLAENQVGGWGGWVGGGGSCAWGRSCLAAGPTPLTAARLCLAPMCLACRCPSCTC